MAGGQGLALAIPDVTPPTVVSFSPADNATGVAVATNLVASMSEFVVLGAAGLISLKKTSDNSVIQTWNVATQAGTGAGQVSVVGGNALTMRLTGTLAPTIEFYVIWDAGVVVDTSANPVAALSVTTTWSFTTGAAADVTPPTVTTFSPLDNATGVAITTNLVATMSETVVLGASGVITLKRTSDNATIDSWNVATASGSTAGKVEVVAGTALTMHLTTSLANSIEYYVIWDAGVVVDTSANPIAANAVTTLWSFTTAASAGATTAIQWMLAPGVEVNAETTSRQYMSAPGVYGNVDPLSGAAFSGLLDVLGVSATRAYSTRKLRSAYAGSAIRIRRSSDNAEQDIGFVGENLDTSAISTFVGANSAYVVRYYDQSGTGDNAVQTTVAQQARIVNAGTLDVRNGKAALLFDGTDDTYITAAIGFTVGTASALAATTEAGPNWSNYKGIINSATSYILMDGNSGSSGFYTGGVLPTISVNAGGNTAVFGSTLMQINAGGGPNTYPSESVTIGYGLGGGRYWPGWIGEAILFSTDLSGANDTAMYTNQKTYWGTP